MNEQVIQKLKILTESAKYDVSCASSGTVRRNSRKDGLGNTVGGWGICHSFSEDGRCISLLKIMLTNYCIYDCAYCINRVSNDIPRATLSVSELVDLTIEFYRRNYIEGLFLSSGVVRNPDYTMERLVRVAKDLREVHRFNGYIHLKSIPGASEELVRQAGRYADRLSVNLEIPTEKNLKLLAPEKDHQSVYKPMLYIQQGALESAEKRKKHRLYEGEKIQSFRDLHVGDYVVHENHGLGIYRGIEKIEVDKKVKDYIKIEYARGGNLYILATQLELIQKYAGSDAKKPKLNRLGSPDWDKTKTRVRGAVKEIAHELVELYAIRQNKEGYVYGPDTVWQKEFEEMFPFEETEDQELAIEATKKDMESTKIMDRLICGDVGYGKTEVAIRAAFKAVQESKQVVYLVPTTILAQQHYNTFVQRMKDFPVRVDMMSRFRTPGEMKKTVEGLKKGYVDIIVGTHRVLSKDVQFKNLGLLIIDEEQRFGVNHKEQIKNLKRNIDVLTLSATPIPRTLHMSMSGIRDMSVIETPPEARYPVQTFVVEYNDALVREAIMKELARGGQVYLVYNIVKTMDIFAESLSKLVPEARIAYAHGQMSERRLENTMMDFMDYKYDVLICSTIIESGLDISNANTMIVYDADKFGLSQLYQLRGRVGRGARLGYAYLTFRQNKVLSEIADKRLSAIKEFTQFGAGFRIAMRDLEIRGAGDILGAEQHLRAGSAWGFCPPARSSSSRLIRPFRWTRSRFSIPRRRTVSPASTRPRSIPGVSLRPSTTSIRRSRRR